nr:MAG TPA: hypothetical protein [Caudoviricetes sp.]
MLKSFIQIPPIQKRDEIYGKICTVLSILR